MFYYQWWRENFLLNNNVDTEYYSNNNYTSYHNDDVHYQVKHVDYVSIFAIIDDNDYVVYNNVLNGYEHCNKQEGDGSTYILKKPTNIFVAMMTV